MVKFAGPAPNERPTRTHYAPNSAFSDAGKRNRRVRRKSGRKRDDRWFARKRREAAAQEKAVNDALKDRDELALQAIATAVALSVLTVA